MTQKRNTTYTNPAALTIILILSIPLASYADDVLSYGPLVDSVLHDDSDLSVDFVLRVIKHESGGNPAAISHRGAMGLMQIMPETKDFISSVLLGSKRDLNPWNKRDNLILGITYLSWLMKRYNGNPRFALIGYNYGPGRMDKLQNLDWGVILKRIPRETRAFIDNIMSESLSYKPALAEEDADNESYVTAEKTIKVASQPLANSIIPKITSAGKLPVLPPGINMMGERAYIKIEKGDTVSEIVYRLTGKASAYLRTEVQVVETVGGENLMEKTDRNFRRIRPGYFVRIDGSLLAPP